jgi:tetratricopeptide (TPR) repeat protein
MEAPDDVDLVDDFAEYHAKYRVEGNVFFADRVTVIKKQRIAPAQFAAYEKFAKAVGDDVTKQSYLSLGSAVAKETPKLVSRPPSAESARLINEARDAYMRRDFRTALSFVQKVIDQDPDYPNAWMVKAGVHMALGENEAAVAALNKDIELHPKAAEGSYRMLDDYYRRTERMPQALELAKKFAENHPDNLDAKVSLGRMYFMQQQYAKAAEVFEKAVALAPSDVTIQFQLALAKLELGQADVAFSSLQDIVKKDPNRLNDAAYMLLDKKVHMDVALAWAEEAVKDVEIQASKIDLQQLSIDDNRTMISLAAYWDTLGWGYFQMGKYADAEKYLRAAYTIMPSTAIAEHYAESLEKNNKRQAAIDVYAVAALASGDLGKKAKQRLQILGPPRMDLVTREARGRSSNSRTFKIPGLKPGKNVISSDVLLLIGHDGKIEDLKFLGSEEGFDEKSMRAMDLGMVFPNDRPAKVFRRGIAMCTPVSGCNLTLLTPDTVRSVN